MKLIVIDCINRNNPNNRTSREQIDTPTDNHDRSNAKRANLCIAIDVLDVQSSDYDLLLQQAMPVLISKH